MRESCSYNKQEQLKERRDKVLKMRNFHYENFNKWSSFFYIIIGALFVGYYNIVGKENSELFQNVILILGYIVSLCWHISNKGYYYWEMHWIFFIIDIEQKLNSEDDKIYSMFYCKEEDKRQCGDSNEKNKVKENRLYNGNYWIPWKPANVSTSKVTLVLSFIIAVTWAFLLHINIFGDSIFCGCCCECKNVWVYNYALILLIVNGVTLVLSVALGALLFSPINHDVVNFNPKHKYENKWYDRITLRRCNKTNENG